MDRNGPTQAGRRERKEIKMFVFPFLRIQSIYGIEMGPSNPAQGELIDSLWPLEFTFFAVSECNLFN